LTGLTAIPEWEVEEAVAWRPSLLKIATTRRPTVIERQKYLARLGRYIDLLLRSNDHYVIVELKGGRVDDPAVVKDQVVNYRSALAEELKVPLDTIQCVLASPFGFSEEVLAECDRCGVFARILDLDSLRTARPSGESLLDFVPKESQDMQNKTTARREESLRRLEMPYEREKTQSSVMNWVTEHIHDDTGLFQCASLFRAISSRAPLMAHEIWSDSNGRLETNEEMWFWLFYSVLDRRANAATFARAKKILAEYDLFDPRDIVSYERSHGEVTTLDRMVFFLESHGFPLTRDSIFGKREKPKSILDAARLIARHSYDFRRWFVTVSTQLASSASQAFDEIWSELVENVYGVGPRIASQFVRGMVLKGPWQLPLSDPRLLESSRYNVYFAGPARLSLVSHPRGFMRELSDFSDRFLEGNKAIVSHVLWYIRKRYEPDKLPNCWECPVAGFCAYYLRAGHMRRSRAADMKRILSVDQRGSANLDAFVEESKTGAMSKT